MELENAYDKFQAQGLGVAAISYDTPEILAHFAERMGGFRYPLLADPGSEMIRAFGILNRNVPEDHAFFGMARPGGFVSLGADMTRKTMREIPPISRH